MFAPLLAACSLGAAATAVCVPLCRRLACRLDLLDRPGGRKRQEAPVALLGGLAIAAGLVAGTVGLTPPGDRSSWVWSATGLAVVLATGLADDVRSRGLSPWAKLLGLAVGGWLASRDPAFRVALGDDPACQAFFVGWFVLVATAFNISDNMDGLAAGLALVPAGGLLLGGVPAPVAPIAVVAGAAGAGFLPYNYPRARIYLGDAGSHLIGAAWALGSCPLLVGWRGVWLVAVPLIDLAFVSVLRTIRRQPPWRGDRRHLSHQLVRLGLGPRSAVALLWALAAIALVVGWKSGS